MNIMIIEDDCKLKEDIKNYFTNKVIENSNNLNEVLNKVSSKFDVFLINVDLPNIDAITALKSIKELHPDAYVILICSTIELDKMQKAYSMGCNDYIKKPFDMDELALKLKLLEDKNKNIMIINSQFKLNTNKSTIINSNTDEDIKLTPNEKTLLSLLLERRGRIVTYETIEYIIWDGENNTNQIRQLINRLKNKIPYNLIQNRRGQGYIIE